MGGKVGHGEMGETGERRQPPKAAMMTTYHIIRPQTQRKQI